MKFTTKMLALAVLFIAGVSTLPLIAWAQGKPEMVTLCHVAGRAGSTQEVTLTIPYNAAFGQAGHFNEDGTQNAGHEQDYLGPCNGDTTTTETTTDTTTDTTTSTTTETTTQSTTTETETNPPRPPDNCPNGEPPIHGQDGAPGNDKCDPCAPPVNVAKCPSPGDSTTVETSTTPTVPGTTTEATTTTETVETQPPLVSSTTIIDTTPSPNKRKPPKGAPANAPPPCRPGEVETEPCGVEGQG